MAKTITVTSLETKTLTSKAGKPYEVVEIVGTTEFQGQVTEYKRAISTFSLKSNPVLAASLAEVKVGDVITLTYDQTKFKNVESITKGSTAPVQSASPRKDRTEKKFTLTDESVRLGAMQVAVAERPGSPVDLERVKVLMHMIRTGEGLDVGVTAKTEVVTNEVESDDPF